MADDSSSEAAAADAPHAVDAATLPDAMTDKVVAQLAALRTACNMREAGFAQLASDFVGEWQGQRAAMETHPSFIDASIMETFVATFRDSSCGGDHSWHALKVSCLLARADANTTTLLKSGGVAAALGVLRSDQTSAEHLEVALALLQNVAYSAEGVASILRENGVFAVLHAMRTHAASAGVQRVGLGVLWNLCDSDEHWVAFLREGPALVTVLLTTLAHHPDEPRIEESVIGTCMRTRTHTDTDACTHAHTRRRTCNARTAEPLLPYLRATDMLWDFSSTGDGQAHIISAGGVPPILSVMSATCGDDDLQKKAYAHCAMSEPSLTRTQAHPPACVTCTCVCACLASPHPPQAHYAVEPDHIRGGHLCPGPALWRLGRARGDADACTRRGGAAECSRRAQEYL